MYYVTLADLITSLEEAQATGRLQARLKVLTHPALLVVDEIGSSHQHTKHRARNSGGGLMSLNPRHAPK